MRQWAIHKKDNHLNHQIRHRKQNIYLTVHFLSCSYLTGIPVSLGRVNAEKSAFKWERQRSPQMTPTINMHADKGKFGFFALRPI